MSNSCFLSVDWGTTNLRLRLVQEKELRVVEELVSPHGIKHVYSCWKEEGGDRQAFFLDFLHKKIIQLDAEVPESCVVVISGMASSSIGMKELPYARLPLPLDGTQLPVSKVDHQKHAYQVYLVSGVRDAADVIRGEEVQIIGLATSFAGDAVYVLPGTHSKHVYCSKGEIQHFCTYMTGEMFDVLKTHSILGDSVQFGVCGVEEEQAFDRGVRQSQQNRSVLGNLFAVRALQVLNNEPLTNNYYYLSGLLIGEELRELRGERKTIRLCAGGALSVWYQRAIISLGLSVEVVPEKQVEKAVVAGQWKVLEAQKLNQ